MKQKHLLVIIASSVICSIYLTNLGDIDGNDPISGQEMNNSVAKDETELVPKIEITEPFFSVSPIALESISSITPLGALNPPSHIFPTDHIYFMITRQEGADRPDIVNVFSPGDLIITSIRAAKHLKADITDYVLFLEFPGNPEISIMFIHFSSLNMEILGDISDYSSWSLESEYSTGGEVYKTWSKNCRINVQAGDIIGQAGGNPGQWALDLGVYDLKSVPEQVANIERWRSCRYLHSVCPLDYYEEGVVRDSLFGLVTGDWIDHKQNLILQDVIGTAQGCWFLEGIKETYPEDLHLALVNSNLDIDLQVLSVGQSIDGLVSGRYGFTPNENGLINRDFKDVTPDGNIYGYIVEGYEGIILIKMQDASTLWVEAMEYIPEIEDWSFTTHKTLFVR